MVPISTPNRVSAPCPGPRYYSVDFRGNPGEMDENKIGINLGGERIGDLCMM